MKRADAVQHVSKLRIMLPACVWLLVFCAVLFQICYIQFRDYEVADCIEYAKGINSLIIDAIDADRVDEFVRLGHNAAGYDEVEAQLYKLRAAYPDVDFSMGEIREYVFKVVLSVAEFAVVFIALSVVLGYVFADRGIVRPMAKMERKAYKDELTGVGNKAAFVERMAMLDTVKEREKLVYAILMVDVNYLKRINDT